MRDGVRRLLRGARYANTHLHWLTVDRCVFELGQVYAGVAIGRAQQATRKIASMHGICKAAGGDCKGCLNVVVADRDSRN